MSSRRSKTPKSRRKKDNSNTFSSRPEISLDGFDYYIRFTSKASPTIRTLTRRRFEESGLFVRQLIGGNEENRDAFFLLRMENTMQLEAAAEHVGIVKLRLNGDREEFEVSDRSEFENVGKKDFFTKSEISRVVRRTIDFVHVKEDKDAAILRDAGVEVKSLDDSFVHVLHAAGLIDRISPLSTNDTDATHRRELFYSVLRHVWPWTDSTALWNDFEKDYGSEVAFYFVWLDFYTSALVMPAIVGLAVFLSNLYFVDGNIDQSVLASVYSVVIFFWAVGFTIASGRKFARLTWEWGSFGVQQHMADKEIRPEFWGMTRVSLVSGKREKYFPVEQRYVRYAVSAVVTAVMLCFAFVVMILLLNLEGYIQPEHDRDRWPSDEDHPFFVDGVGSLAKPGAVFDPNPSNVFAPWFVPIVLHVIVVMALNAVYREVAVMLNEWENHKYVGSYENSLIIKRFLFEAFDAYLPLVYLAFYEFDVVKLRSELCALYTTDSIRRVLTECVLPLLLQTWTIRRRRRRRRQNEKKTDEKTAVDLLTASAELEDYEEASFDDYLEIILEFGYVSLFSSAFPLASFLSVICNLVEIRSDAFKLLFVARRPRSLPASGPPDMWMRIIFCQVWLSALTNCLVFAFSSQQMMMLAPDLFFIARDGDQELAVGSGRYVVLAAFGIEHALILLGSLMYAVVPKIPSDVRVKMKRREYNRAMEVREMRIRRVRAVCAGGANAPGGAHSGEIKKKRA